MFSKIAASSFGGSPTGLEVIHLAHFVAQVADSVEQVASERNAARADEADVRNPG